MHYTKLRQFKKKGQLSVDQEFHLSLLLITGPSLQHIINLIISNACVRSCTENKDLNYFYILSTFVYVFVS